MSQPQRFICTVDPSKDGFMVCKPVPTRVQVQSAKLQVRKLQAVNPQPSDMNCGDVQAWLEKFVAQFAHTEFQITCMHE